MYLEATQVVDSIPNWNYNKVSFKLSESFINCILNVQIDTRFGLNSNLIDKDLNIQIINRCYYFRIKWDNKEIEQVLSPSDSYALSLMIQKAKERIYGW